MSKQTEIKTESKQEDRRKLIIADAVLQAVSEWELPQKRLNNILEKYVTEKTDREFMRLTKLADK